MLCESQGSPAHDLLFHSEENAMKMMMRMVVMKVYYYRVPSHDSVEAQTETVIVSRSCVRYFHAIFS